MSQRNPGKFAPAEQRRQQQATATELPKRPSEMAATLSIDDAYVQRLESQVLRFADLRSAETQRADEWRAYAVALEAKLGITAPAEPTPMHAVEPDMPQEEVAGG